MRGLTNKIALITGGSQGIGQAIVQCLVSYGVKVVIADLKSPSRVSESIIFSECDVTKIDDLERCVQLVCQTWGGIDILVNNAAEFLIKGIDASMDEWRRVLDVNVIGYAMSSRACLSSMETRGGGAIVNISSISGVVGQKNHLTYSASKGAICSMTRCMAVDFAPFNMRVNTVCPGMIWTEANARYLKETRGLTRETADVDPELGGKHLLNRYGNPEEVAEVVAFLASDLSSFVTGSVVMVDGGYTVT